MITALMDTLSIQLIEHVRSVSTTRIACSTTPCDDLACPEVHCLHGQSSAIAAVILPPCLHSVNQNHKSGQRLMSDSGAVKNHR